MLWAGRAETEQIAANGSESVVIDKDTTIPALKNEIRWNACCYR